MIKLVRAVTGIRATGNLFVDEDTGEDGDAIVVGILAHISKADLKILKLVENMGEVVMRIEPMRPVTYDDVEVPNAAE